MKINLPNWLRRKPQATAAPALPLLPSWATVADHPDDRVSICVDIDTDAAMNQWMKLLDAPSIDQYWIEVAYQCAKLDVQMALVGTPHDPRVSSKSAEFRFDRAPQWGLARHPHGRGTAAATQGREARGHYVRVRGRMPF